MFSWKQLERFPAFHFMSFLFYIFQLCINYLHNNNWETVGVALWLSEGRAGGDNLTGWVTWDMRHQGGGGGTCDTRRSLATALIITASIGISHQVSTKYIPERLNCMRLRVHGFPLNYKTDSHFSWMVLLLTDGLVFGSHFQISQGCNSL